MASCTYRQRSLWSRIGRGRSATMTLAELSPVAIEAPPQVPRRLAARRSLSDLAFVTTARATGMVVLLIVLAIGLFLGWQVGPTVSRYGWAFFTRAEWQPNRDLLGIAAAVVG